MTRGQTIDSGGVERVSVQDARRAAEGGRALLVCAYDDARCARIRLQGSLTTHELEQRMASVPREQEIIFYCA
jgi:hypothetical protein